MTDKSADEALEAAVEVTSLWQTIEALKKKARIKLACSL
jgi:hypothetical protein